MECRPSIKVGRQFFDENGRRGGERAIPEETAVALIYNGGTYAVMMATPDDLQDFAVGFSLSERIVASADRIQSLDIIAHKEGIELQMWLDDADAAWLSECRRMLAGPTGCGLCGTDSLDQAIRPSEPVSSTARFTSDQVMAAVASVAPAQKLNRITRAVHGAAFWHPARGLVALREDVGRHNALDKLAGVLARARCDAAAGIVVLTSRVSIEMVQKAAVMRTGVLAAVSAPTALAVRAADEAGLTLIGVARADGFEVFTHGERVMPSVA